MDPEKLRAWWFHKQGLDGTLAGRDAAAVLKASGWSRSVGGVGPYLTLFSRAGLSRQAADDAVARVEICELPSARGCTYVVPADDYCLALTAGHGFNDEMSTARKLGVTDAEIDELCRAVVDALNAGPRDPDGLRQAVGGAARSLGPDGAKRGLSSTLPVALEALQQAGEIRRVPVNGRLDQQRYRYTLWRPNPVARALSQEEAFTELARRFFAWIGPAAVSEFQWFSGLGVKAAKAAVAPLGLAPLADSPAHLMFRADRDAFEAFRVPSEPRYALVSSLDAITQHRRDLKSLVAPEDAATLVQADKTSKALGSLTDLPSHGIFDRGRLIGLWEYDVDSASIVWALFGPCKPDSELKEAVRRTEEYVRADLGDARSFSLDSPKSRAPRIEALRKAAKTK